MDGVTEYTYDALGQLLTETVNGVVVNTMTYDNYGNILTKTTNGVTKTYEYNCTWKDKLTAVDGVPIVYDNLGNPISYLGHNLTWEKGRQLKQFTKADGTIISYTYNANGIRTSKTVDGVKHTYFLDGTKILKETWGDCTMIPLYDNEDSVCGIIYDDAPYYFYKNLQGDIIEITNKMGSVVARYTYDAWGKVTSITDDTGVDISNNVSHVANANPFRYRGYYYDAEIGMYYLQSRYYNPAFGKFINSDTGENVCLTYSLLSNNVFCYCENDPINDVDDQGNIPLKIIKLLGKMFLGALTSVLVQFVSDTVLTVFAGKTKFSTWGTYAEVACTGALDALWNQGIAGSILNTIIANTLGQVIDLIRGKSKKFSVWSVVLSIVDCVITYLLEKKLRIAEPKYIRDIKEEARGLGVKGKHRLEQYLEAKSKLLRNYNFRVINLMNVIYNIIKDFVLSFLGIIGEWIISIAYRIKETITPAYMERQYV